MNKEVSFKESRIVGTTILLLGTGFLMSWVPDGNYMLLMFNFLLEFIAGCLFYSFCIVFVLLFLIVTLPYVYSRKIAYVVQKPSKSKIGKIYLIYLGFLLSFGGSAYMGSLYTSNADAITLALFTFLGALFLLFLA